MPGSAPKKRLFCLLRWLLLPLLLLQPLQNTMADEALQRRVLVGLKVFPAVLAASKALAQESGPGVIKVIIVFRSDREYAEELSEILRGIQQIKGKPLVVETRSISQLRQADTEPPFGIFIAQRNEEDIEKISRYGCHNNTITFSPFDGDVEKGILAGIAISDRILPLVNSQTLAAMPTGLKAFFLKVAEIHEP